MFSFLINEINIYTSKLHSKVHLFRVRRWSSLVVIREILILSRYPLARVSIRNKHIERTSRHVGGTVSFLNDVVKEQAKLKMSATSRRCLVKRRPFIQLAIISVVAAVNDGNAYYPTTNV